MTESRAAAHLAAAWERKTGAPPSRRTLGVLWGQWAMETGRGQSMYGFNFAGIKGKSASGRSAVYWTKEGHGPTERRVKAEFRHYATPEAGADDYVRLLAERYPEAMAGAARGDAPAFVRGLASQGYFTADPAMYSRAVTRLQAEFDRTGGLRLIDPGPAVDALLWTLQRAIAKRA